jgi:trimethylamine--corrinoid protein Co-methyltransferase
MESGMGALLAALGGINIVSGPGFLNYENTQSLEKLVLDNDACRLAHRLVRGFDTGHADIAGIIHRHAADGAFLGDPDTRRHHRDEIIAAGRTVNRGSVDEWARKGHPTARDIAREEMERLLSLPAQMLDGRRTSALKAILIEEAEKMGCGDQMSAILESEIPPC